jgi:hypothetical protein
MSLSRLYHRGAAFSLVAAAFLAACSGQSNSLVPSQSAPFASHTMQGPTDFTSMPAACIGQKTTATHATLDTQFSSKGGKLCIPAIAGWGGSVTYPPALPAAKVTLTSSVKNYNKMPNFQKGAAPLFYLQVGFKSATAFGKSVPPGGALIGKTLVGGKTYTALAGASVFGIVKLLGGCYAVATKGKDGGTISGIGTVLKHATIPGAITGIVEIYAGKSKSAKDKC